jgi:hypothetical protein
VVEDIFAARMALHIAGRGAEEAALGVFGEHVARLPAAATADATGLFKREQKIM